MNTLFFIFFLFISSTVGAQSHFLTIGAETKYAAYGDKDCWQSNIKIESCFVDSAFNVYATAGYSVYAPVQYNLSYITTGIGITKYFRTGKHYQPGITIDGQTVFKITERPLLEASVFNYYQTVSGVTFKSIPFVFAARFVQLYWFKQLGFELGLGYRHTTLKFDQFSTPYKSIYIHNLELGLGVKYQFK